MKPPIESIVDGTRKELLAMPWAEYLAYPALNPSTIVVGRKSMRHLRQSWEGDDEDSDAKLWGRAMHCLLYEPREFPGRYRPWDGRRAGNAFAEFEAEAIASGAEVIRRSGKLSFDEALLAAESFLQHALVCQIIKAGKWEQTVFAVECGLQCKGRIDGISTAAHCISDLKTSNDISARKFGKTFACFGYHIRLGLYQRWLAGIIGEYLPVQVICLESKRPYDVAVVPVPQPVLDSGTEKGLKIIGRVAECIEKDEWPGICSNEPYPLDFPVYEMDDGEDELVEYTE